jgi:hypothetical protein
VVRTARAIRTPRAAGIAGVVFSVLFTMSAVLTAWAIPDGSDDPGSWVTDDTRRRAVAISLRLLPFAGIAFLWFIGVIRNHLGEGEDRLFATVFLGSGLLFVGMTFVAAALESGLIETAADATSDARVVWPFAQRSTEELATEYALRMAGVFTISTSTLTAKLHVVPRWLTALGYVTAIALLFGLGLDPWIELAFPIWVFVLSGYILIVQFRRRHEDARTAPGVVAAG